MSDTDLTIIIPTYNRPQLLPGAIDSALNQTTSNIEIIVVDDGSNPPAVVPENVRIQLIRRNRNYGLAAARNAGTRAARSRWITYLDDDDQLLPHMAEVSLAALSETKQEPPVALLSGLRKVDLQGEIISERFPPPLLPKGSHFFLEEIKPGYSYFTKSTLVVERDLILKIGGWDESFQSRTHSELFLRLGSACTLIGIPTVNYVVHTHDGDRLTTNPALRQKSFRQLIQKHREKFAAHPKMYARFLFGHVKKSAEMGHRREAIQYFLKAWYLDPVATSRKGMKLLISQ